MRLYFKSPCEDLDAATGIMNGLLFSSVFWILLFIAIGALW